MKTYTVRLQPMYQTCREFTGKNAKRDAKAWAKKVESETQANMGDKHAKATVSSK